MTDGSRSAGPTIRRRCRLHALLLVHVKQRARIGQSHPSAFSTRLFITPRFEHRRTGKMSFSRRRVRADARVSPFHLPSNAHRGSLPGRAHFAHLVAHVRENGGAVVYVACSYTRRAAEYAQRGKAPGVYLHSLYRLPQAYLTPSRARANSPAISILHGAKFKFQVAGDSMKNGWLKGQWRP